MLKQSNPNQPKLGQITPLAWLIVLLAALSLACSLIPGYTGQSSGRVPPTRTPLPTFTVTPAVDLLALPGDESPQPVNPAPVQVASGDVKATRTPLPTLTPTPRSQPAALAAVPTQPANTTPVPVKNSNAGSTLSPTATVTPLPPANPTAAATTGSIKPTATQQQPPPPPTQAAPVNPIPEPALPQPVSGWSFVGVSTVIEEGNAFVIGEMVNNTGVPQTEVHVSSILYDEYGQVIVDEVGMLDYIPVDIVPDKARIPFELAVESSKPIYRLDLVGASNPSDNPPRQEFEFSNVRNWQDEGMYCLGGQIKNRGAELAEYLIVMATGYNDRGQVVNFGEYAEASLESTGIDQTAPFEMCIDQQGQHVVYHQLSALGY